MHILALIVGILITGLIWAMRLMRNKNNIADAANTVHGLAVHAKNLPRQRRFKKAHNRKGFDLVETPTEAATVLMIMMARSGDSRHIDPEARDVMETLLRTNMNLSDEDADGMVRQMDSLTHDIVLPESSIPPMTTILREHIQKEHARDLADMLSQVAMTNGEANLEQLEFLRRFKEPFDLN